jgi:hypothetical protein
MPPRLVWKVLPASRQMLCLRPFGVDQSDPLSDAASGPRRYARPVVVASTLAFHHVREDPIKITHIEYAVGSEPSWLEGDR